MSDSDVRLMLGDCLEMMPLIPDQSVDAIICDPPYPCIDRPYGRMTEAEWWAMMMGVCRESRRILKPNGSAVFILQPNSRKVGSMRGWLFRFQAWACDEWNMVQDAWWWNTCALPVGGCNLGGLLRPSLKACVWLGPANCYRNQDDVLLSEAVHNEVIRKADRDRGQQKFQGPSGLSVDPSKLRYAVFRRGGVTPFNCLPIGSQNRKGTNGHAATTPLNLCDWWVRYISPEGGRVCDPFMGSGTTGLAALNRGRSFIGIERDPGYFGTAQARLTAHRASTPLLNPAS